LQPRGRQSAPPSFPAASSDTSLAPTVSAEEKELKDEEAVLEALQSELAERELEVETMKAEMNAFEARYLRVMGLKYAELDRIRAEIARLRAERDPEDIGAREEAAQARARAEESEQAQARAGTGDGAPTRFEASDELRHLYREAAKKTHPDLGKDEEDRAARGKVFARVNSAYEAGDADEIRRIISEWEERPEAVIGGDLAAQVRRVRSKIIALRRRLEAIDAEMRAIRSSDLYRLRLRVEDAESEGRDLLADMATALRQEIDQAGAEMEELRRSAA